MSRCHEIVRFHRPSVLPAYQVLLVRPISAEDLLTIRHKLSKRKSKSESIQVLIESLDNFSREPDTAEILHQFNFWPIIPSTVDSLLRILHVEEKSASSHRARAEPHYVLRQQPEFNRRLSRRADELMDFLRTLATRDGLERLSSSFPEACRSKLKPISATKRDA